MNSSETVMIIRKALDEDLPSIEKLLAAAGLHREGLRSHLPDFLVAESNQEVIGAIGPEVYESEGLLRSVVVAPVLQRKGIGDRLLAMMTGDVRERGIRELFLLTTTAREYFARKGFSVVERRAVQGAILSSSEFRGACPSTAIRMEKTL